MLGSEPGQYANLRLVPRAIGNHPSLHRPTIQILTTIAESLPAGFQRILVASIYRLDYLVEWIRESSL